MNSLPSDVNAPDLRMTYNNSSSNGASSDSVRISSVCTGGLRTGSGLLGGFVYGVTLHKLPPKGGGKK